MTEPIHLVERITRVTPLGVRFWDRVFATVIGGNLKVTSYPAENPARLVRAFTNRLGIYVLRNLPGLHDIEHGTGDADFWNTMPPKQRFIIEVIDEERRFQPFLLKADLPVRNMFTWECGPVGSPPSPTVAAVPLYSAPSRPVPGGMAVLRADLWDPEANAPAAWAMIEARMTGCPPMRGIADAKGRIALIFPYPEPFTVAPGPPLSSPPVAVSQPLIQQEWTIHLHATYKPRGPVPPIPDLCDTLMQPPATLWADSARTRPFTTVTLKFGQELIARSYDTSNDTSLSALLITQAGSPP